MRKIGRRSVAIASVSVILFASAGVALAALVHFLLPPFEYRALIVVFIGFGAVFFFELLLYRLLARELRAGPVAFGGRDEFYYETSVLVWLMFLSPIMRAPLWPVPLSRALFRFLGAQIGANSYTAGVIFDPKFVKIGANCILGHLSMLCPHEIEGQYVAYDPIELGDNVTVGAFALIMAGCRIGDGAIIAMNSVVTKGAQVGPNEIWAGVPARLIKTKRADEGH